MKKEVYFWLSFSALLFVVLVFFELRANKTADRIAADTQTETITPPSTTSETVNSQFKPTDVSESSADVDDRAEELVTMTEAEIDDELVSEAFDSSLDDVGWTENEIAYAREKALAAAREAASLENAFSPAAVGADWLENETSKVYADLAKQVGEDAYIAIAYAMDRPNRVVVDFDQKNAREAAPSVAPGEVILTINGQRVFDAASLRRTLNGTSGNIVVGVLGKDGRRRVELSPKNLPLVVEDSAEPDEYFTIY